MTADNWLGQTVKFTIGAEDVATGREPYDCYLTIGEVGEHNADKYPHLVEGEPCHLDITLSRVGEELRVYTLLTDLATRLIFKGESPRVVAQLFRGQAFEPSGWVSVGEHAHYYRSIPDFIGSYILRVYYEEE